MSELRVSYEPDEYRFGKVTVRVATKQFAGETAAWTDTDGIADFARSLRAYPLSAEAPPTLVIEYGEGGAYSRSSPFWRVRNRWFGRRELPPRRPLVRITLTPYGPLGKVLVSADLQTDDPLDFRQVVAARFLTGYPAIVRFAAALERIAENPGFEAVLVDNARD